MAIYIVIAVVIGILTAFGYNRLLAGIENDTSTRYGHALLLAATVLMGLALMPALAV